MFRVLQGLTYAPRGSARPIAEAVWAAFGRSDQVADPGFIPRFLPFALYFIQQRMVAARASISPTMSPAQQQLLRYLPVVFAVFQVFFLAALVAYYIVQTLARIVQQAYITRSLFSGT